MRLGILHKRRKIYHTNLAIISSCSCRFTTSTDRMLLGLKVTSFSKCFPANVL